MMLRPNLLFLFLLPLLASAQSFRLEADVAPVRQSGYHRIALPPDVVGRLNPDLTDLRLFDADGREIPYVLNRQPPGQQRQSVPFELVSQTTAARQTTLILRKQPHPTLYAMTLYVGNTAVSKRAQLSGSPDARQWYALRNDIRLDPITDQTTAALRIDVPASDYTYYRLVISDSLSAPLNIRRVTYDSTVVQAGTYAPIDKLMFEQRDSSDRKTYCRLLRPEPARFARLALRIDNTEPYRRQAVVGLVQTSRDRRGQAMRYVSPVQPFTLQHDQPARLDLTSELTGNELYVVIDNGDSPPLRITGVQAWQFSTYLTAKLTPDTRYQLRFSADNVAAPQYDLAFFRPALNTLPGSVDLTSIRVVGGSGDVWGLLLPRWLIWVALGAVLLVVSLLTYRMLTDVDKRA